MKNTSKLKQMIQLPELSFLMEAHNGMSSKIVEEAGFSGIWGSGLSISAALGVRDNNEASWTQVLDVVEFMADATDIPILLDGDTGYGNFNNFSRVVRKLEQRGCAGVCIEDKLFPKTNSFIDGDKQELTDVSEFAGKIKAGCDTRNDDDFVIVARVEAFIAGWGLAEAMKRAEAYMAAGADAILMHSKLNRPDEILAFMKEWGNRLPVVIVPTKYYSTPVDVFESAGVSTVIWANHLMRSSIAAMQGTAKKIYDNRSLMPVEDNIATVAEIFRLQGADDLKRRESLYFPEKAAEISSVILAAACGKELRDLTEDIPKALLQVGDKTILERTVGVMNEVGVKNITVVRGFAKEKISLANLRYVDNDEYESTQEVYSLNLVLPDDDKPLIVSYGDILYKKYVLANLLDSNADITLVADAGWKQSKSSEKYADYVICDQQYDKTVFDKRVCLKKVVNKHTDEVCGEWIGLLLLSSRGRSIVKNHLNALDDDCLKTLRMQDLLNELVADDVVINVQYIHQDWVDIDDFYDLSDAQGF